MSSSIAQLKSKIRNVQNFPFPGAVLRDISPLLADPASRTLAMSLITDALKPFKIDVVAGMEPRGVLIAPFIAASLNVPYVVIRKASKLPNTTQVSFKLPFGEDTIEITNDDLLPNQQVLVVDDILALGIATIAGCELIEKVGAKVAATFAFIELEGLNGRKNISDKNYTVAPSILHLPTKD